MSLEVFLNYTTYLPSASDLSFSFEIFCFNVVGIFILLIFRFALLIGIVVFVGHGGPNISGMGWLDDDITTMKIKVTKNVE